MLALHSFIPHRTLIAAAFCLALLLPACSKKAAKTTPPVLVPSIQTEPLTPAEPEPEQPTAATAAPEPENPPAPTPDEAQKPKPKPRKPVARKPATPAIEAPKPEPAKVDTPAPAPAAPTTSVQITADVPRAAVQSQTQTTEQLLRSSEAKLASLARSLNESEQAMQRQARNYIAQSNEAVRAGDIERAYNLAVKASLLANELAK
jgi:outer membrane biosynthesis protein TonB